MLSHNCVKKVCFIRASRKTIITLTSISAEMRFCLSRDSRCTVRVIPYGITCTCADMSPYEAFVHVLKIDVVPMRITIFDHSAQQVRSCMAVIVNGVRYVASTQREIAQHQTYQFMNFHERLMLFYQSFIKPRFGCVA